MNHRSAHVRQVACSPIHLWFNRKSWSAWWCLFVPHSSAPDRRRERERESLRILSVQETDWRTREERTKHAGAINAIPVVHGIRSQSLGVLLLECVYSNQEGCTCHFLPAHFYSIDTMLINLCMVYLVCISLYNQNNLWFKYTRFRKCLANVSTPVT